MGFDLSTGFVGTKISGPSHFSCTNFDKLLILSKEGTYKVVNIPEKQYFENLAWAGLADKKTILNVVYKNLETGQIWAKRFIVEKFILDKVYRFLDEKMELEHISTRTDAVVELHFAPKGRQKVKNMIFALKDVLVKGAQTRGIRIANQKVKKVTS